MQTCDELRCDLRLFLNPGLLAASTNRWGFTWNRKGICQPWVSEGEDARHLPLSPVCELLLQRVEGIWAGVNSSVCCFRPSWFGFSLYDQTVSAQTGLLYLLPYILFFSFLGPLFTAPWLLPSFLSIQFLPLLKAYLMVHLFSLSLF